MKILGIDPGYAIIGFGVLKHDKNRYTAMSYGNIRTESNLDMPKRLLIINNEVQQIISKYAPDSLAIEKLYFTTNQKTALAVAQARGIILLGAAKNNLPVFEYTPLQIKQSVVGYGKATKKQVITMITSILRLEHAPKVDDTADALAVALCHAHSINSRLIK